MIRTDKCLNCGSLDIGKGYWSGYAALMPLGKPLSRLSCAFAENADIFSIFRQKSPRSSDLFCLGVP